VPRANRATTISNGAWPTDRHHRAGITLEGDANGAPHSDPGAYAAKFSGRHEHRTISGWIGHNLPQEASAAFADAIIDVDGN
jgi:hypothetical protein